MAKRRAFCKPAPLEITNRPKFDRKLGRVFTDFVRIQFRYEGGGWKVKLNFRSFWSL